MQYFFLQRSLGHSESVFVYAASLDSKVTVPLKKEMPHGFNNI